MKIERRGSEAKRRRFEEAKMRRAGFPVPDPRIESGAGSFPTVRRKGVIGWDAKQYTLNICMNVPDVKSYLIFCSITGWVWG